MRRIAAVGVALVLLGAGTAQATREAPTRIFPAKIRCRVNYLNEDQAANLKLVNFSLRADGTQRLVYRCKSHGY